MSQQTVPTQEEVAQLPHWARVAFAARCARRVLPLFEHSWPDAPGEHVRAVDRAVRTAEEAARTATIADARVAAAAAHPSIVYCFNRAAAAAAAASSDAAAAAATVVYGSARPSSASAAAARTAARTAAPTAALAAETAAPTATAVRRDFDLLRSLARRDGWTDDTPVPPDVFGPLWPDGPPPDWPAVDEPGSQGVELVLTLDVPEGMTGDDVLRAVAELAAGADRLHRAYGGHGLEVREGNVDIDREVPQLVPAGGLS